MAGVFPWVAMTLIAVGSATTSANVARMEKPKRSVAALVALSVAIPLVLVAAAIFLRRGVETMSEEAAVRDEVALKSYCAAIKQGQAWSPGEARANGYGVQAEAGGEFEVTLGLAFNRCHVQLSDTGRVMGVQYFPD